MRRALLCVALLVACAVPAHAGITCWYNNGGSYTGADDADARFPLGMVTKGTSGGDYAYGFTVGGMPTDCPKQLPPSFYAAGQARVLQGVLTSMQNQRDHSTVYLLHDKVSDSDFALEGCSVHKVDMTGLAKWVGKPVVVTASEVKGAMCVTGYLPATT